MMPIDHKARVGVGFMAALLLASVLNPLNTTSLAVALVDIARDLHPSAGELSLVVAMVYIISAIAQPLMGYLTEQVGVFIIFYGGLLTVILAGIIGGVASNIQGLLVARALIGIGTSSAVPAALVLLRHRADALELGTPHRELALLAAAGNVMAAVGLPLGGFLVSSWGWRAVFFFNVPPALIALTLGLLFIPRSSGRRVRSLSRGHKSRLDYAGVGLFATAISALALFVQDVHHLQWQVLFLFLISITAFVMWEKRTGRKATLDQGVETAQPITQPFIDINLMARKPQLCIIYLRFFLLSLAVYSSLYGLSQWLEVVHHLDSSLVGLMMLPQSVMSAMTAILAGKTRRYRFLVLGTVPALVLAGLSISGAALTGALVFAILASALAGIAFGLGMVGNQAQLYEASTATDIGVASGLSRTSSYIGGFMATALMGTIYSAGISNFALIWFALIFVVAGGLTFLPSGRSLFKGAMSRTPEGV